MRAALAQVDESYFGAKGKTSIDSVIHSNGWRGYNGLVDFGYKKHFRVQHSILFNTPLMGENEFARGNSYIKGIESFFGLC